MSASGAATSVDGLAVEASNVTVRVGMAGSRITWDRPNFVEGFGARRQILARASMRLERGEFAAVIGESGAGKTTLLRALAGVLRPTGGTVTVGGRPVSRVRAQIGYVPQESIVHDRLSVREALSYAARLRLPVTAGRADLAAAVTRVLSELDIEKQASVRIGDLSGGQRKRVAVGTELLNSPRLLFLDEPTTGLDPALEARLMGLFRELADHGRTLVVATHATRSLALCDKLAVIGRGGHLAFFGTPRESLAFFGVDSFDDIYRALIERPAHRWRGDFEGRSAAAAVEEETAADVPVAAIRRERRPRERRRPIRRAVRHTRALSGRYLRLFTRDRRNLALLLLQAPIIALAIVAVFDQSVLLRSDLEVDPNLLRIGAERPDLLRQFGIDLMDLSIVKRASANPFRAAQLLFALVIAAIFLGSVNSAREVVKERTVVEREAAAGVGAASYLTSKLIVLLGLVLAQVALVCAVVFVLRPIDEAGDAHALIFGLLALVAFVAVAMGLVVSAASRTQEQAIGVIPLTLIPQLIFTGAIVPVAEMSQPVAAISRIAYGQPAFAGLGAAIDINGRIAGQPAFTRLDQFGRAFFAGGAGEAALWLGGFLLLFLALALLLLPRRRRGVVGL